MLSDLRLRLKALVRRRAVEAELDDELRFHFEEKVAKLAATGLAPEEARRRARLAFGGLDQVKEECRQARGVDFVDTVLQDLRFGCRMLARSWRVTAVVVLSVALGVAANTTVFGWIRATLLDPLPGVTESGRLAALETLTPAGEPVCSSFLDYRDFRDQARLLAGVIAFRPRPLSMGEDAQAERAWALMVSPNYFDVLGVRPARGRFFSPAEQAEKPGAFPVAVISSALWRRGYGGDPQVAGRTVRLNRQVFTIIGVTPETFRGTIVGLAFDVYAPLAMEGTLQGDGGWLEDRKSRPLDLMARLRPGVGGEPARAEVAAIAARLARTYPRTNEGIGAALVPVAKAFYGLQNGLATLLLVLMGVSLVVLLIVCANVGNLLLARALARRRETAIRAALGASRRRLLRQLLTECLLLAVLGGAAGVLCSLGMADAIRVFAPATDAPLGSLARLDGQVLGFAFLLALVTGVVFGFAPALHATRPDLQAALKEGGRGPGMGARTRRLRALFVVSEVALALLTLTGAGLLLRSYQNAKLFNPGFDARQVQLARFELSTARPAARRARALQRHRL
jgi:predicted permease